MFLPISIITYIMVGKLVGRGRYTCIPPSYSYDAKYNELYTQFIDNTMYTTLDTLDEYS